MSQSELHGDSNPVLEPVRLSRLLHARRETVFRAWTSAEHVTRWFAPETYTVPEAKVEMQFERRRPPLTDRLTPDARECRQ